jgi:hypothetical protein
VASIPGAHRVAYITTVNEKGVGEAIAMRAGVDVDLLVFFSAASGDARPMAPAMVEKMGRTQYAAMAAQAPGRTPMQASAHHDTKGVSAGTLGLAVVVVAVLAMALATPALLRRRHEATAAPAPPVDSGAPPPHGASAGQKVDDRRERNG